MDICEVVWGSAIFYATRDEPALVKDLLELACATYTAFLRAWEQIVPFREDGNAHWGHVITEARSCCAMTRQ